MTDRERLQQLISNRYDAIEELKTFKKCLNSKVAISEVDNIIFELEHEIKRMCYFLKWV